MIHDITVPNVAAPRSDSHAQFGTITQRDAEILARIGSGNNVALLITNSGEMSVKTSLKARGLFGSVGNPGMGSSTTRTAPTVGKPQFAPVTVS